MEYLAIMNAMHVKVHKPDGTGKLSLMFSFENGRLKGQKERTITVYKILTAS